MTLFIGMVFTIPEDFMQKKTLQENTTKLGDSSQSFLIIYPTPKASQIEKTLNYHVLLDMLLLILNQIQIQKVYHILDCN